MRKTTKWPNWVVALMIASCTPSPPYHLEKGELFPGNKPVGQPYTSKQTHIRMVRVSSVQEADSFFVALCRNRQYDHIITGRYNGMDMHYYRNDSTDGEMIYTHDVPPKTYEVGIIYIWDTVINGKGIREVHFVETIKPSRE